MFVAPHQTAAQGQHNVQSHYQPSRACRQAADVQGACASCSTPAPFFGVRHLLTGLLLFRAPVEMFHPSPSMEEESTLSPDARAGKPSFKGPNCKEMHSLYIAAADAVPVSSCLLACSESEGVADNCTAVPCSAAENNHAESAGARQESPV